MAVSLSDPEASPKPGGGKARAALHRRLRRAQTGYVAHGARAIVVVEGWGGAGKADILRRLTDGWDMRHVRVWAIDPPTERERARHYLARFWEKLPAAGEIALFERSWYGRVLTERVAGRASDAEWRRAYDEINEFEAQQADAGTTIVKLFLHIGEGEQRRRLARRLGDPATRRAVGVDDIAEHARYADHMLAVEQMLARTDTRWAPWTVIDAAKPKRARLAAMVRVADRLERAVPSTPPPPDGAVLAAARAAGIIDADEGANGA